MKIRTVASSLLAAMSFGMVSSALAAGEEKIRLVGCPVQPAPSCLMLRDDRGTPYDISAAPARSDPRGSKRLPPSVARGRAMVVTGSVVEGVGGRCRRGVVLGDIQWRYTQDKCAVTPASAARIEQNRGG